MGNSANFQKEVIANELKLYAEQLLERATELKGVGCLTIAEGVAFQAGLLIKAAQRLKELELD